MEVEEEAREKFKPELRRYWSWVDEGGGAVTVGVGSDVVEKRRVVEEEEEA